MRLLCTQQQSITPFTTVLNNIAGILTNAAWASPWEIPSVLRLALFVLIWQRGAIYFGSCKQMVFSGRRQSRVEEQVVFSLFYKSAIWAMGLELTLVWLCSLGHCSVIWPCLPHIQLLFCNDYCGTKLLFQIEHAQSNYYRLEVYITRFNIWVKSKQAFCSEQNRLLYICQVCVFAIFPLHVKRFVTW